MIKTAEEITEFSDTVSLEKCVLAYCKHSLNFYYMFQELEPVGKKLCLTYRRFLADLEHKTTAGYYEYALLPSGVLGLKGSSFVTCLYFMDIASSYRDDEKYYDALLDDLMSYGNEVFAIATNKANEQFLRKNFGERINIINFM